jgi:hypothetical protein
MLLKVCLIRFWINGQKFEFPALFLGIYLQLYSRRFLNLSCSCIHDGSFGGSVKNSKVLDY